MFGFKKLVSRITELELSVNRLIDIIELNAGSANSSYKSIEKSIGNFTKLDEMLKEFKGAVSMARGSILEKREFEEIGKSIKIISSFIAQNYKDSLSNTVKVSKPIGRPRKKV